MSAEQNAESPCFACWCYTCGNLGKCLKNGHACFGCLDKPRSFRAKPKEAGACGGYILEETPAE